jgi:acyl-CoA hydrolase
MGTVTITINVDNAAFDEPGEFARIVAEVAAAFEASRASARISDESFTRRFRDINGNTVATATFEGV